LNTENKGLLLGVLGVISFGLTLPATRFVIDHFHTIFIGLGRAVVAGLFAILILVLSKQPTPSYTQFKQLALVALGVVIGFPVLSAAAMQTLPASHGGVVLGVLPLATAAIAALFTDERPSIGFWMVGLLGSLCVITYSLSEGSGNLQFGDLLLFAAIICAAVGYAVGGNLSKQMGGWQVICWALVVALPFIALPAYIYAPTELQSIPTSAFYGFLYLALVSQLFGFFFWYAGLAIGGVTRVSQTQLLQPFVTIAASAYLLDELVEVRTFGFAMAVMIIVAISKNMPVKTLSNIRRDRE
jgi:drug/metabolite transporter (DMT)-like permease